MSRFFFDKRETLVDDAIDGLILATPYANLVRLDIAPGIRVVARSGWDKSRVAIISGGGSGHEPAHAGYVGKGMLTAAVCGDLFASPSVDAVFNAIVALTGERGCLLIVKNYTGDRLNFGLAAEKARRYGLQVEMVIVGDDVALPDNPQPRGIAGTALVHKIAGYAAERGRSLAAVCAAAQDACARIYSLGVALRSCSLPDGEEQERIRPGQVELGLGIHGEPGASTLQTQNSRKLINEMATRLREKTGAARLAVMINNLGGTSELEMSLLVKALVHSPLGAQTDFLIGPAPLVSALDMKGFSLSAICLNDAVVCALQSEVHTLGWRPLVPLAPAPAQKIPPMKTEIDAKPSDNPRAAALVQAAVETLIGLERRLNALDAKVGDGDTGSTFALGARDIGERLAQGSLPLNEPDALLLTIGERLATAMGGSSGVLMSILFTAAGQALKEGESLPAALLTGLRQMRHYGGAAPGDRTLVDALQPALEALQKQSLDAAVRAAQEGAQATAKMKRAAAGRASYVGSDSLNGVEDPGAVAVAEVFSALAKTL
ncbi:dihydroxyacetone kinase subunit DhaK [Erwinia sp. HR93]|uniref:dihydroxyacetone kinase subunit DhaK n=1 Tax=Erwinia sp. HR93 TaxID=3094840 RepID=UPI002ADEE749|nr:dihydroxyacetone kinase subunit DhaK [Erwinia sp. HR93]MEA1063417.1 dihydroxyacetone kinase subunit DhaK [Erwinia sp. HR93]